MRHQSFEIRLKSEVSLGSPGTTQGGRDNMDYLSGSFFLGAAAARLYRELGEDAWTVFHSGKVRFNDALPLSRSGSIAFPMPQSLATGKHQAPKEAERFTAGELINLAYQDRSSQMEKPSVPYLSAAGEKVRPKAHFRLKTAIDPRSGASMDRRLYGYHSLAPDQLYHFTLDVDEDVPNPLLEKILTVFNKPFRLGRSLSAEYGRCEATPKDNSWPNPVPSSDGSLTLLLCSHLVVEDENGVMPPLPQTHHLGLPPGELILERCFVRHGWHSFYNSTYRAFEGDLPIIMRGSVLCYRMAQEDLAVLNRSPIHHAGLQQQRGFGRFLVNPPFLAEAGPKFESVPQSKEPESAKEPNHPLVKWLKAQLQERNTEDQIRRAADTWYQELKVLYNSARVRGAFTADMVVGPTPSQWGRVAEVLSAGMGPQDLQDKLFGKAGVCKSDDPDWSITIVHKALERSLERPANFADWLKAKVNADAAVAEENPFNLEDGLRLKALAHFARFAADRAKQQRNQQEVTHA
jgi:hypothetical protein